MVWVAAAQFKAVRAGFTVLAPGEQISVFDPLGMVLYRPADPQVIQLWKPLRDVKALKQTMPDGTRVRLLTEVLVPPADAPQAVRHYDGSVTLTGGGKRAPWARGRRRRGRRCTGRTADDPEPSRP